MEPFTKHTGIVAPLDRVNVDTDQIIPKQFLKRIERTGFGQFLFFDWRFGPDGSTNEEFELNDPAYRGASILLAGRNFGCGSSREHAPWALREYGFRAIIAPSFADIFHKNCFENGLVPVILSEVVVGRLMSQAKSKPGSSLTVDLESCRITGEDGLDIPFTMHDDPATHEFRRRTLLHGLDEIDMVLQRRDEILAFEAGRSNHGGVLSA